VPVRSFVFAIAGLGAPLLAYAAVGLFSRYAADDYCTAGQVLAAGFVEAQARLYSGWSGRYAATFLVTLLELIGPVVVPLLPALTLMAWLGAATWTLRQLAQAFGWRLPRLAALAVAAALVFATLSATDDLAQDLYWQTGIVTYLFPLVLATAFVGWLAQRGSGHVTFTACGVSLALALAAGGTSETFAAAQVAALGLAIGGALLTGVRPQRGALLAMLGAGLLGALLALAILGLAPGNAVREEFGNRLPLSIALPLAFGFTRGWLRLTFALPNAAVLLLVVGLPAYVGAVSARTRPHAGSWLILPGLIVATLLVILACMLPAFYALGSNPPGRAQIQPEYVLMCSLVVLGFLSGAALGPRRWPTRAWVAVPVLGVLIILGPLVTTGQVLAQVASARDYALAWDRVDGEIRAARSEAEQDVTVRPLASTGNVQNLDFIGPNRADWLNECVARYYGVRSIGTEG
jgi:hypothetical protein